MAWLAPDQYHSDFLQVWSASDLLRTPNVDEPPFPLARLNTRRRRITALAVSNPNWADPSSAIPVVTPSNDDEPEAAKQDEKAAPSRSAKKGKKSKRRRGSDVGTASGAGAGAGSGAGAGAEAAKAGTSKRRSKRSTKRPAASQGTPLAQSKPARATRSSKRQRRA